MCRAGAVPERDTAGGSGMVRMVERWKMKLSLVALGVLTTTPKG